MNKMVRSPFFYVGDKYKLMPQLEQLFPNNINNYIEPFVGGGSSFLNSKANNYYLNDIDKNVIKLHKFFQKYKQKPDDLFEGLYNSIKKYNLSCSYKGIEVPNELKSKYKKKYYSIYNKNSYLEMREDFNNDQNNENLLYLLLIYGFNHMIRFNSFGKFNLPVGNVDYNKNVHNAIINYLDFSKNHNLIFYNMDYREFLNSIDIKNNDYVFLDPPYLISMSEYNKLWNETKEKELYAFLDELNNKKVRFGITNLVTHKGKINNILLEWSKKYIVYDIKSNYISYHDNTIKNDSKEVFITNYGRK